MSNGSLENLLPGDGALQKASGNVPLPPVYIGQDWKILYYNVRFSIVENFNKAPMLRESPAWNTNRVQWTANAENDGRLSIPPCDTDQTLVFIFKCLKTPSYCPDGPRSCYCSHVPDVNSEAKYGRLSERCECQKQMENMKLWKIVDTVFYAQNTFLLHPPSQRIYLK